MRTYNRLLFAAVVFTMSMFLLMRIPNVDKSSRVHPASRRARDIRLTREESGYELRGDTHLQNINSTEEKRTYVKQV